MPFEGPSFKAPEVLCHRPWRFAANSWTNFMLAPPLRTFNMYQTQVTGGGVVYGNGICLHTSTFHSGAVSTTTFHPGAVSATFCFGYEDVLHICILQYVICHGLCGLYTVFLSRTILATTILEDIRPHRYRRIPNPSGPTKYLSR